MGNITKKDLVTNVAACTGISKDHVKGVVEAFMGEIITCLSRNRTIEIRGFGTFSCKRRKGRPALNPRTKEVVHIPERLAPTLRFSEAVQKRITIKEVV